jgi:hypothetical protein
MSDIATSDVTICAYSCDLYESGKLEREQGGSPVPLRRTFRIHTCP